MLKIKGLEKRYRNFPVLKGLNMNIEKGDVYGFLGQNGCGKTTTLNIICNVVRKDGGSIVFDDENTRIGYLPETPALYGYMNGFEYLGFIAACCDYQGDVRERTKEVLQVTRMYDDAHRLIKGYSRGMNQRIGIAAAIYANPDLLILDEPTSALDPDGRAEVMEIINNLADSGATIILCTHILGDVERVANKVGIMQNGIMAVEGGLEEIKDRYSSDTAVVVRLLNPADISAAAATLDVIDRYERDPYGDFVFHAKKDVNEAELFYRVITALGNAHIVPEGIWFRRLTLEQIYIGISSGYFMPQTRGGEEVPGI